MKILESYKKMAKQLLIEQPVKFKDKEGNDHEIDMDTAKQYKVDIDGGDSSDYKKAAVKAAGLDKDDSDAKGGDAPEKEPAGKLGSGDFERDGGEKSDKGGDTKKVSSVDDDTYDETEDAMDNLRYSGTPSDEPMMIKHLGDMVDNFMSGNASDEDVDKAQEIVDTLDNISQTNDEDPEAFDKLGMALQVGINQHKKLKGDDKPEHPADAAYRKAHEPKGIPRPSFARRTGRELETITIDGKKYKAVKESREGLDNEHPKKHALRLLYERIGGK